MTDPVIELQNSKAGGLGSVIVGGYVYRGDEVDFLDGMYLFGVWSSTQNPSGIVFMANTNQNGLWDFDEVDFENDFGQYLLGFGQDS
ncbi:MAG: hypothetical protein HC906_07080, partial [Bacteroidales bacterium]|nr:hypothetical protein [Bacteroidales bacterium]